MIVAGYPQKKLPEEFSNLFLVTYTPLARVPILFGNIIPGKGHGIFISGLFQMRKLTQFSVAEEYVILFSEFSGTFVSSRIPGFNFIRGILHSSPKIRTWKGRESVFSSESNSGISSSLEGFDEIQKEKEALDKISQNIEKELGSLNTALTATGRLLWVGVLRERGR
jgi:hypothetical protein